MSDAEVAVPANYLQTRFVGLFHAVASKVFWAGFFWELFGECLADNKYHTAKYAFLTGLGDSSGVVAGHLLYFTALAGCSMDAPAQEWPAARLLGTASLATGTCWQPLVNLCLDDFGFGFLLTFFFVGAVSGVVFFAALRCGRLAYDDAPNNGLKVYHDASLALAIAGAEAMPGAAPDPRTRPRAIARFVGSWPRRRRASRPTTSPSSASTRTTGRCSRPGRRARPSPRASSSSRPSRTSPCPTATRGSTRSRTCRSRRTATTDHSSAGSKAKRKSRARRRAAAVDQRVFSTFKMLSRWLGDLCPRHSPRRLVQHHCSQLLEAAMGKAGKAAAKKKRSTKSKALLGKRCDAESMMVVDAGSPGGAAPLTGRQKHAEKVAAKRALRDEKASIKKQRLAMPKASTATRGERKALTTALKELSRPAEPAETAADAAPAAAADGADAAMTDDAPGAAFAYAVDAKKARRRARQRAKHAAL